MMQVDPMYDVAQYMTSSRYQQLVVAYLLAGMSGVKHGTVIRDDAFNLRRVASRRLLAMEA